MKIEVIEVESYGKTYEHVFITNQDGSIITMLKSTWDELEAAKEAQSLLGGNN